MKSADSGKHSEPLVLREEQVEELFNTRFIKVYDLKYREGKHYFDATRRPLQDLVALKSDEEAKTMLPDAVTCFVILLLPDGEPRLLLFQEYRYPAGRFLLSPPAGLIDPEDRASDSPLISTAKREIFEETGLTVKDSDRIYVVSPFSYSTPGMTDESNALVCAVISLEDTGSLSQDGAVGSEMFDGFDLVTREEAQEILKTARDAQGHFFSLMTWSALMYFISDQWR